MEGRVSSRPLPRGVVLDRIPTSREVPPGASAPTDMDMTKQPPLILVVDDDADFRAIVRHMLESAGYRVVDAPGPADAAARMAEQRFDLVISDLMMDSLDAGFAFARRLRQDPATRDVPLILATSAAGRAGLDLRPRTDAELAEMHADAFFDKPVRSGPLLDKVRELLARRPRPDADPQ